jgi:hypothetical protein
MKFKITKFSCSKTEISMKMRGSESCCYEQFYTLGHNAVTSISTCLTLISCLVYSSTLMTGVKYSSETSIDFNRTKFRTWYVPNTVIWRDLQIPTVKVEIRRYSSQYNAHLSTNPNDLIVNLMELPDNRRLRRHLPNDLPTRFLM